MTFPDPLEPEEAREILSADLDSDMDVGLDGDLDAGIEAGFGPRPDPLGTSGGPAGHRPSLLDLLVGGSPRVSLREPASGCPGPSPPAGDAILGAALGKYELQGEIARGGIGLVLKGKDPHLGREVAVKILHERHRSNPVLVERFIEEAQIGGQLEHPGVVPVYELAEADGRPYFAMKLVHGRTLAALLAERKAPGDDLRRFLAIFERVAQTVAYAHARGVIHRDLKPANIMVGAFGEVQVMDWGLAKVLGVPGATDSDARRCEGRSDAAPRTIRSKAGSSHSVAGSVMGTPAYMAPEQARGEVERLDERADVFSLGAILCEILSGAAPYVGEDSDVVLRLAASASLAGAQRRVAASGVDAELITLANDCLMPAAEERPRSAEALAERVSRYLAAVEARAQEARISAAEEKVKATAARRAQRLTLGLAVSVLATLLLGGGGWLWVAKDREARVAAGTRKIHESLGEAEQSRGKAKASPTGDLSAWTEALAAAGKAASLAAAAGVEGELVERVAATLATLREEEAAARKRAVQDRTDAAMRSRLESIAIPEDAALRMVDLALTGASLTKRDADRRDAAYAREFRDYGIAVENLPVEEAATRVRGSAIARALAIALDDWAFARRDLRPSVPGGWQRLLSIAAAADPDPLRKRLREALLGEAKEAGDLKRAIGEVDLATVPPVTLHLLGKALMSVGAAAEAAALLERSQRRHPGDFNLNLELAVAKSRISPADWNEAIRFYTAALAVRPENREAQMSLAGAEWQVGQLEAAAETLRDLVRRQPDYAHAHSELGRVLLDQGKLPEAVLALRRAISLQPGHAPAWVAMGRALREQGQDDEALKAFEEAVRLDPLSCEAYWFLCYVLQRLGRSEDVVRVCRATIRLQPGSAQSHWQLGIALLTLEKFEEAIGEFREAVRLEPAMYTAHSDLGKALRSLGRTDDALRAFDAAVAGAREEIRRHPELVDPQYSLGESLRGLGDFDAALEAYRAAIFLHPDHSWAHLRVGQVLWEEWDGPQGDDGKLEEAIASLREAGRLRPNADALANLAYLLRKAGRLDESIAASREVLRLWPEITGAAHETLGDALREKGELEPALEAYETARGDDPEDGDLWYNIGRVKLGLGRCEEATEAWERAHEHEPRHVLWGYLNTLGFEKVRPLLARLCEEVPSYLEGRPPPASAMEQLVLAKLCFEKGHHAAATRLFQAAFALEPDIARADWCLGRWEAANAAALAGCGESRDAAGLDAAARAGLRSQALAWLREDHETLRKILIGKEWGIRRGIQRTLLRGLSLRGVRDEARLALLPEPEREAWRKYWEELRALIRDAGA